MSVIPRDKLENLTKWLEDKNRKPLLIRGARQVGKSSLVREFAKEKKLKILEVNFERSNSVKGIFEKDLDPNRILDELSIIYNINTRDEDTLIFFDEIQEAKKALTSLRYFYEEKPEIKIIAAGSLIEFILEEVGFPVGRIRSLYLYPLTFKEFLQGLGDQRYVHFIENLDIEKDEKIPEIIHSELISKLKLYLQIGGMPKVASTFIETRDYAKSAQEKEIILRGYIDDFEKYAKKIDWDILRDVFRKIGFVVGGSRVKYNSISQNYASAKIKKGFELLEAAQIIYRAYSTNTEKLPLFSNVNLKFFKTFFLDIGLLHHLQGFNWSEISTESDLTDIDKGRFAEQFVAQEIIAKKSSSSKYNLHYWERNIPNSQSEIDFVIEYKDKPLPIEVKSGKKGTLKSLAQYIKEHNTSKSFIFSSKNIEVNGSMVFLPLYMAGFIEED